MLSYMILEDIGEVLLINESVIKEKYIFFSGEIKVDNAISYLNVEMKICIHKLSPIITFLRPMIQKLVLLAIGIKFMKLLS